MKLKIAHALAREARGREIDPTATYRELLSRALRHLATLDPGDQRDLGRVLGALE